MVGQQGHANVKASKKGQSTYQEIHNDVVDWIKIM